MARRPKILITSPGVVPAFARQDAHILSAAFDTELLPISDLGSIRMLGRSLERADALLTWFLGRHALPAVVMARRRGIPIVSVIGGFEVAWVEELKYGIRPGSLKERILRWMVKSSSRVLSVSEYSRGEGLSRFPEFGEKFLLVPNAVDTERFGLVSGTSRRGVICVGAIDQETIGRKSWTLFRETARQMSDLPFVIVGRAGDAAGRDFVENLPGNITWRGVLEHDELIVELRCASVYLQLSIYESFCVALAEAMACGCFPVVSGRAALPEVVDDAGTVLHDLSPSSVQDAVRVALRRPEFDRGLVRQRVVDHFGIERRRRLLTEVIASVLASSPI